MNFEVISVVFTLLSFVTDCRSVIENKKTNGRQVIMYPQGRSSKGSALIMLNGIGNNQSQIDEQQLYSLSNNIQSLSNLVTSQTNLINTLSLELAKMKRQLFDLDLKKGKDVEQRNQTKVLKNDLEKTKKELAELKDEISKANSVNTKVNKVNKSLKSLEKDIKEIGEKSKRYDIKHGKEINGIKKGLKALSSKSPSYGWPGGHYCILASGRCPSGFKRLEGYLKALYMYSSGKSYVKEAKFGDSQIGCYGSYCGQYGNWIGKLQIAACCK